MVKIAMMLLAMLGVLLQGMFALKNDVLWLCGTWRSPEPELELVAPPPLPPPPQPQQQQQQQQQDQPAHPRALPRQANLDFDVDADSDSTCRDTEDCLCHWCKRVKLKRRFPGYRPTLQQRADDHGLDTDGPGWVCDLRGMGEISDGEWAELYPDSESSGNSSDSQEQAQPAAGAEAPGGSPCP